MKARLADPDGFDPDLNSNFEKTGFGPDRPEKYTDTDLTLEKQSIFGYDLSSASTSFRFKVNKTNITIIHYYYNIKIIHYYSNIKILQEKFDCRGIVNLYAQTGSRFAKFCKTRIRPFSTK